MSRSLAGTNGVPLPEERMYLRVVAETDEAGETRPLAVLWPDGRRFDVASSACVRNLGRWELGTRLAAWEISFSLKGRREVRRILWWERGRWFVARRSGSALAAHSSRG